MTKKEIILEEKEILKIIAHTNNPKKKGDLFQKDLRLKRSINIKKEIKTNI